MSCLPGVWVYIVRFAGALDLARMEFWRAALLRSNVEVARQTLEKSAHESSSNDVILVFVLGCCCPGPRPSLLGNTYPKKKQQQTDFSVASKSIQEFVTLNKISIRMSHMSPISSAKDFGCLHGGLEFEWKCFRISLEGGLSVDFSYSNVYNGVDHNFCQNDEMLFFGARHSSSITFW